jgi:hypothetical protein
LSKDIISRLIDLDARCRTVVDRARQEAGAVKRQTQDLAAGIRAESAARIKAAVAEIEAGQAHVREVAVAETRDQFAAETRRIAAARADAIARAVDAVVRKAGGAVR